MTSAEAVAAFEGLLEQERQAARLADVGTVESLQHLKRTALAVLKGRSDADPAALERLGQSARRNLVLLRQLVKSLEVLQGAAPATYDKRATFRPPSLPSRVRSES